MKQIKPWFLLCILLATSSCKTWWSKAEEEKNPFEGMTAEQLYNESQHLVKKKQYDSATKRLEAIETMYPFSDYTEDSQLDLMFAYYENEDYPSAAATADRFIHLYPRAQNVDYAYYLKALANFQQLRGVFAKYLPLDESWRDPGTQAQAFADFEVLIQRFPNSKYKANALQHMIYLRNMFARHELHVSQYYFKLKMYVAAIERASYLVKNYPQSPCVQTALIIMYQSNRALGLNNAAEEVMHVYQANYHTDVMYSGLRDH
ncbi:MAG: outer membrane protein assembly factor BamD [Legionella sp.]|nr:outer membrane protein assembly factor BamD [Legionella sp.]